MAKVKTTSTPKKTRPGLNPETRELQLISRAVDLAEQQLMDGTASSQVITHFLKLGSTRERLERERLEEENKLLRAKTKSLEEAKEMKEIFKDAIRAMKVYSGEGDDDQDEY